MPATYPAGKVLKHCDLCKRWGASYLVEDAQGGRLRLCRRCWQSRMEDIEKARQRELLSHELDQKEPEG